MKQFSAILLAVLFIFGSCDTDTGGSSTTTGGGGTPTLPGTVSISVQGGAAAETGCTLVAAYGGAETVSFQWNKNGSPLSGKTATTLITESAGSYTVTASAAGFTSKTSVAMSVTDPIVVGLVSLAISINRADSSPTAFVFRTTHPSGTTSYDVKQGVTPATAALLTTPDRVSVTSQVNANAFTELTATAKKGADASSLATKVPGMTKYASEPLKNGYTDWFKFLSKTLIVLNIVDSSAYDPYVFFGSWYTCHLGCWNT